MCQIKSESHKIIHKAKDLRNHKTEFLLLTDGQSWLGKLKWLAQGHVERLSRAHFLVSATWTYSKVLDLYFLKS